MTVESASLAVGQVRGQKRKRSHHHKLSASRAKKQRLTEGVKFKYHIYLHVYNTILLNCYGVLCRIIIQGCYNKSAEKGPNEGTHAKKLIKTMALPIINIYLSLFPILQYSPNWRNFPKLLISSTLTLPMTTMMLLIIP